jgi:hypothetical protein
MNVSGNIVLILAPFVGIEMVLMSDKDFCSLTAASVVMEHQLLLRDFPNSTWFFCR